MSLYNMIHGENAMGPLLLAALGLSRQDVPRYRDCYWNGERICIYTRTGGGNREFYESLESCRQNYPEYFDGKADPEGPWNADLRELPGFDHDEDDDFDCTYATFYFTPPPALRDALMSVTATDATPRQKWEAFFERLQSGDDDPQIARVMEATKPLMESLKKFADEATDAAK